MTKTPLYLYNQISFRSDVHNLNIRFEKKTLTLPIHKPALFERYFSYNIAKLWNSIPDNCKSYMYFQWIYESSAFCCYGEVTLQLINPLTLLFDMLLSSSYTRSQIFWALLTTSNNIFFLFKSSMICKNTFARNIYTINYL